MPNNTCILDSCQRPRYGAREYCEPHHRRWRSTGDPVKPCLTCGTDMTGTGSRSKYCSPACRQCSVEGCGGGVSSGGLCALHDKRMRARGTVDPKLCPGCGNELEDYRADHCSDDCKPRCKADECDRPRRSLDGYCARHKVLVRRNGVPFGTTEWTPQSSEYTCVVCGTKFAGGMGRRKHCSSSCQVLDSTYSGNVPSLDFDCVMCGRHFKRDRKKYLHQRADKKVCDECRKSRSKRHKSSPGELARLNGPACGICGHEVDLDLKFPDRMRGSVDHIVPVAHGGGHEKENLQLAHLSCNVRKQARLDYIPENSI